jgi:hypothetical protein
MKLTTLLNSFEKRPSTPTLQTSPRDKSIQPYFGKNWDQFSRQPRPRTETPAPNQQHQRTNADLFDGINPNNPAEREELISSILEDVEAAPALHGRLTAMRADHPAIQRFSQSYPRTYIQTLSNIAVTYQEAGLDAAQADVTHFIQEPDLYLP